MVRFITNLICTELEASKVFYSDLFGFEVVFDSDWFVNLKDTNSGVELGLLIEGHAVAPPTLSTTSGGMYLTLVVEAVEPIYERAQAQGYAVLAEPEDTFYGQRRLLLQAPEGTTVDVSALIPDFGG
ncbi:MAG TPA: glyoxalase [Cytophagales bacterium]|nr:glyoxalase [Cytophagales bacterium]HAP60645.1 glyoxalase [Cytophagales bacterium]